METKPTVIDYINDQPRALRITLQKRELYLKPFENYLHGKEIKKVIFMGSGTSYNASVIATYYAKHILGIDAQVVYPTQFVNYEKPDWSGCLSDKELLIIGISQSGTSLSTIAGIKKAKESGLMNIAFTGNMESEITKYTDMPIHLLADKEMNPPETRGYTITVLSLYLLVVRLGVVLGLLSKEDEQSRVQELSSFLAQFESVLDESFAWYKRNKELLLSSQQINVIGYGIDYGTALEGMLKVGEMLRRPTIAYEVEEYIHGHNMSLNPKEAIIIFGSNEVEYERMLLFRATFKKYTQNVFVITNKDLEVSDDRDLIFSNKCSKLLAPLMYTVPMQIFAAQGAMDVGIDTSFNPFLERFGHL